MNSMRNEISKLLKGADISEKQLATLVAWASKIQDTGYAAGYLDGMQDCEAVYRQEGRL